MFWAFTAQLITFLQTKRHTAKSVREAPVIATGLKSISESAEGLFCEKKEKTQKSLNGPNACFASQFSSFLCVV